MSEIKLVKRIKFAGDVHAALMELGWDAEIAAAFLHSIPDTDAVEVVRCKDCKHRTEYFDSGMYVCKHEQCPVCGKAAFVADDHFCGYGERRVDK